MIETNKADTELKTKRSSNLVDIILHFDFKGKKMEVPALLL